MWNFVSRNKTQLALSAETKFHKQKYNTCRYIEKQITRINFFTMVQYTAAVGRVRTLHPLLAGVHSVS
jgi:hypothetical protein